MYSPAKTNIMLVIAGILTLLFLSAPSLAFAQSNTTPTVLQEGSTANEELKEQVATTAQQTSLPLDTVTIGSIVATAGGLLLNDRRKSKQMEEKLSIAELEVQRKEEELKKKQMEVVEIIMALEVVNYKIFNSAYIYEDRTFRQVLDLKSTNNPLEKNTLGEEYAIQINKLAKFTNVNYNVPMPNMSIPSSQVINASSVSEHIKMVATTPPPTHVVAQTKAGVQAPASGSNTVDNNIK